MGIYYGWTSVKVTVFGLWSGLLFRKSYRNRYYPFSFRNMGSALLIVLRNWSFLLFWSGLEERLQQKLRIFPVFSIKSDSETTIDWFFWLIISSMKVLSMNILLIHSLYRKQNNSLKKLLVSFTTNGSFLTHVVAKNGVSTLQINNFF